MQRIAGASRGGESTPSLRAQPPSPFHPLLLTLPTHLLRSPFKATRTAAPPLDLCTPHTLFSRTPTSSQVDSFSPQGKPGSPSDLTLLSHSHPSASQADTLSFSFYNMVSPTTTRRTLCTFRALLVAVLLVQVASASLVGSRLPHRRALAVERAAALSRADELEKRLVVAPISLDAQTSDCEEAGAWHSLIHPPLLRLFKRRGGDDDDEDEDSYDDEEDKSSKKSSKYDDENDEEEEDSSKSRKASKTRSAWDDEETSSASRAWGSNGALPTVTPFGAPLTPQATPAAGQPAGVGGATWAVGEHKSQVLVAQLQKARQRAMDASRLAGSAAAGAPAAAGMAAYVAPSQMGWISPAAGDAFVPNQEVVLSW